MADTPALKPGEVEDWLDNGVQAPEIERLLCERGFSTADAKALVDDVIQSRLRDHAAPEERRDRVRFWCGIGCCVVGVGLLALGWTAWFAQWPLARPAMFASGVPTIGYGAWLIIRSRM